MMELFQSSYYWLDLLVGYGSPVVLYVLYRRKLVAARDWRLFWLGALIGLTWEIPIFMLSAHAILPIVTWIRPFPTNYAIFMISHTLWDGAIFVVGVWLVAWLCKGPILARFAWAELVVLLIWGQVSAFLVEFSSISNDGWMYVQGYWWNPTVLWIDGRPINLLIQIVWLAAPILFYLIALKMNLSDPGTPSKTSKTT